MVLYNITIIIEENIQESWLSWVKNEHIPAIMSTELFLSNKLLRVLDSPNEGITYCLQFIADDFTKYTNYIKIFGQADALKQQQRFENKFVSFSTVMEYIN